MDNTVIETKVMTAEAVDAVEMIEAAEVVEVKPYTLRKLSADDIFIFSTILKQIGFKEFKSALDSEEIKGLVTSLTNKNDDAQEENPVSIEKIGISIMLDVAGIIIANLECAKDSIYKLLSKLSGMNKEEIAALDMEVFVEMIIDVFKQEGFRNFFKVVSKLF